MADAVNVRVVLMAVVVLSVVAVVEVPDRVVLLTACEEFAADMFEEDWDELVLELVEVKAVMLERVLVRVMVVAVEEVLEPTNVVVVAELVVVSSMEPFTLLVELVDAVVLVERVLVADHDEDVELVELDEACVKVREALVLVRVVSDVKVLDVRVKVDVVMVVVRNSWK